MIQALTITNERDNGRIQGKLNNSLTVVVNGDYGADHCALSEDYPAENMAWEVSFRRIF